MIAKLIIELTPNEYQLCFRRSIEWTWERRQQSRRLRLTRVGKAIWVIVFLRHRIEIDINVSQADSEIEWKNNWAVYLIFSFYAKTNSIRFACGKKQTIVLTQ
jgi:hypothetical protein